jgi:sulfur relay (sulfurtransferase) DsrF/TusC family protein
MHEISDIATDSTVFWVQQTGPVGGSFTNAGLPARLVAIEARDGIEIFVVIEPAGVGVVTAFPK